jgi:hypothetical protein
LPHNGLVLTLTLAAGALSFAQRVSVLHLDREISLPGVEGRIDHLSADIAGQRVFVAALGNGTVEVVDLGQNKRSGEIKGLKEPQGVAYVPASGTIYVASGGDGVIRSYDGRTLKPLKSVALGEDADNLRYDAVHKQILAGYGSGAIAVLGLDLTRRAELRLPVHPESFQLSADSKQLFVNLPDNKTVAAIDMEKLGVNSAWGHPGAAANFPMALDGAADRLLIACRHPARLVMMNGATGTVTGSVPTVGDADDVFYDKLRKTAYVIGGEGFVEAVRVEDGDRLASVGHVPTAPGARTGLYVAEWNKLLVAAPHQGAKEARLLVYSVVGP